MVTIFQFTGGTAAMAIVVRVETEPVRSTLTVLDPKKRMCTSTAFGKLTSDYHQQIEAT